MLQKVIFSFFLIVILCLIVNLESCNNDNTLTSNSETSNISAKNNNMDVEGPIPVGYTLSIFAKWSLCHYTETYACPVQDCIFLIVNKGPYVYCTGWTSLVEDYPGWVSFNLEGGLEDGHYVVQTQEGPINAYGEFDYYNDQSEHYGIASCTRADDDN